MIHCPDWKILLEHRFDPTLDEPEDWHHSLEHLQACEDCRIAAYEADPSLLFLDLPAIEVSDLEVREMQQAVTTLRQGLRVARNDSSEELEVRSRRWAGARLAASLALAVGLLAGAAGIFGVGGSINDTTPVAAMVPETGLSSAAQTPADGVPPSMTAGRIPSLPSALLVSWQDAPVVEEVGGPLTRIYNYPTAPDEKIALVMVIDPALDV